jgi:hypothetical protein
MRRRRDDPERLRLAARFMQTYRDLLPVAPPEEDPTMAKSTAGIGPKGQAKAARVFKEFGKGELHAGKGGPVVTKPKQAVAIALSQARDVSRGKK